MANIAAKKFRYRFQSISLLIIKVTI
jgi:hypothetical protein